MKLPYWVDPRDPLFDPILPYFRAQMAVRREWENLNRKAVQKVREWERRYYTPYEGERIDACVGLPVCIVDRVDIRNDEVIDTDGRRHSLGNCVDPYGWRAAYVDPYFDADGEPIDPNEGAR